MNKRQKKKKFKKEIMKRSGMYCTVSRAGVDLIKQIPSRTWMMEIDDVWLHLRMPEIIPDALWVQDRWAKIKESPCYVKFKQEGSFMPVSDRVIVFYPKHIRQVVTIIRSVMISGRLEPRPILYFSNKREISRSMGNHPNNRLYGSAHQPRDIGDFPQRMVGSRQSFFDGVGACVCGNPVLLYPSSIVAYYTRDDRKLNSGTIGKVS